MILLAEDDYEVALALSAEAFIKHFVVRGNGVAADQQFSTSTERPFAPAPLLASNATIALAALEGVDLKSLRLPALAREPNDRSARNLSLRLLTWPGTSAEGFAGPSAARGFFEKFELFPGRAIRAWGHPCGRLGFGLDGNRVIFETHLADHGLLISGTPEMLTFAYEGLIAELYRERLFGARLETLVDWPPASGAGYLIDTVEDSAGMLLATVKTTPVAIP